MKIWGEHHLKESYIVKLAVGKANFQMFKYIDEFQISSSTNDLELDEALIENIKLEDTTNVDCKRFIVGQNVEKLIILPALPDLAIIVKPDNPIVVLPNKEAQFFVTIPIWVQFRLKKNNKLLMEEPSLIRSKTWFGDIMDGEMCYSLTTSAKRDYTTLKPKDHRIITPIKIKNTKKLNLSFEKICIRVNHLKVFTGEKRLWTNSIEVNHDDEGSKVKYLDSPPTFEKNFKLLNNARSPLSENLFKKTFGHIRFWEKANKDD